MQSDISVLVIEDEETWMQQILYHLDQFGYKVTHHAYNIEDALTAIRSANFDVALLDINLNGKNSGIELGKLIGETRKKPFIFITSSIHDGIIDETAAARPSAFLTKPFNPASLYISIQSAIHHFTAEHPIKARLSSPESFFVKVGNKYIRVEWENVVCLRSEINHTNIITSDNSTYLIRSSLQRTIQHIIPETLKNNFVQINRAEVLHSKYIEKIIDFEAIVGRHTYGITETYIKNLKQQLNIVS